MISGISRCAVNIVEGAGDCVRLVGGRALGRRVTNKKPKVAGLQMSSCDEHLGYASGELVMFYISAAFLVVLSCIQAIVAEYVKSTCRKAVFRFEIPMYCARYSALLCITVVLQVYCEPIPRKIAEP